MDILTEHERCSQVNHTFCDAIRVSPLLQHKIDLWAAGLEYNVAAGVRLVDSRNALIQYRSNLNSLRPTEERTIETVRPEPTEEFARAVGGVYAIAAGDSIRLLTLGSALQKVPHKEWAIPLPVCTLVGCHFYPGADIIAFVELQETEYVHWPQELKFHVYPDVAELSRLKYKSGVCRMADIIPPLGAQQSVTREEEFMPVASASCQWRLPGLRCWWMWKMERV